MKKRYARSAFGLDHCSLPLCPTGRGPVQVLSSVKVNSRWECFVRTYGGFLEPNHNKNFVVRERTYNKKGEVFEDATNGFKYELPEVSYKYTAVPDVTPEQGVFDEAGFNEHGVSISATVSASANDNIKKVDPYVEEGLAESALTTVVLPSVKTAREGVELIAKIVEEKGSRRKYCDDCGQGRNLVHGDPFWSPICSDSFPRRSLCSLSKYLLLRTCRFFR